MENKLGLVRCPTCGEVGTRFTQNRPKAFWSTEKDADSLPLVGFAEVGKYFVPLWPLKSGAAVVAGYEVHAFGLENEVQGAMALRFPLRPAGDRERLVEIPAELPDLMLQPEGVGAGDQPQL